MNLRKLLDTIVWVAVEEGTYHIVIENRELNDGINIMIHCPGGRATGQKETKTPRSAEKSGLWGFWHYSISRKASISCEIDFLF